MKSQAGPKVKANLAIGNSRTSPRISGSGCCKNRKRKKTEEGDETNWMKSQNTPVLGPHIVYGSRRLNLEGLGPGLS
jgi:hypothetical protein